MGKFAQRPGVGWGEVINGGFGMLLDGSPYKSTVTEHVAWDAINAPLDVHGLETLVPWPPLSALWMKMNA